ncbi:uncharacterized protein CTRU02_213658 [Colletotrichum truncatum]|uniref:Uncharacterized protein n=1 Tax=Colletotrichum truncatum TaxID=5467 RepID=A0ACC3YGB9_COLTU|nr:uncharacterized protein CTRU02_11766 [Colletotrichum truncatum]KAF6785466.1 hypothetical protein CTRU02_11766 [Colletotrichum truncatum]
MNPRDRDTLGTETCGFFTLSVDKDFYYTRVCDDLRNQCLISGSWLGCADKPATKCFGGSAPECAPGKVPGSQTMCCPKTPGRIGQCQTFLRNEGTSGTKTLLGCRDEGLSWEPTVWLSTTVKTESRTSASVSLTSSTSSSGTSSSSTSQSESSSTSSPSLPSSTSTPTSPVGTIVGGVLGGMAILAITGCTVMWLVMRSRGWGPLRRQWPAPPQELQADLPVIQHGPQTEGYEEHSKSCPLSPISPLSESQFEGQQIESKQQLPKGLNVGSPCKPAELG